MKKLASQIEHRRFKAEHKQMVRKWYADGGETNLRYDYDIGPESVVLDLGGYEGQWASDLFARYQSNIYVFEPVKDFAQQIENRFKKNDRIRIFPFGLGGSTRDETIHLSADGSSCWGSSDKTESIRIVGIDEWLSENGIEKIDLMKINIEGGEFELLEKMLETGSIAFIENIQVQFHNFADDSRSRMENIQQKLAQTHYPTYQYDFVWENWEIKKQQ